MGQHHAEDGNTDSGSDTTRAMPASPTSRARRAGDEDARPEARPERGADWGAIRDRVVGLLVSIVRWAGLVFALVLVLHVIFVVGEANPDNGIVSFADNLSGSLAIGFEDLFMPDDPKLTVLVNYGIAAIFWLVVSSIVARIIRAVGGVGGAR